MKNSPRRNDSPMQPHAQYAETTEPQQHKITELHSTDVINIDVESVHDRNATIEPQTAVITTIDIDTFDIGKPDSAPSPHEWRKKMAFFSNATNHTKNLQRKITSQATSLGTKMKRGLQSVNTHGAKNIGLNIKSNLRSVSRSSQPSPKQRKKLRDINFTSKLRSIPMPKMPRAELPRFKLPELPKFKMPPSYRRSSNTATITTANSAIERAGESDLDSTEPNLSAMMQTKATTMGRFDSISYPKFFNRLHRMSQPKTDEITNAAVNNEGSEYDAPQHRPSIASFSSHFATVPRTASRIKKSIKSKLSKARNGSEFH